MPLLHRRWDATACNVLKADFARYTAEVANGHGVPLRDLRTKHAGWSEARMRWREGKLKMPVNVVYRSKGTGVLLVPERFLRELPVLDAAGFWGWAYDNVNETLREEFNYDLSRRADAKNIRRIVSKRPDLVRRYMRERKTEEAEPYNIRLDPKYLVRWFEDASEAAQSFDVTPAPSKEQVQEFVQRLCEGYKDAVENQGAWELLWVKDAPRSERHAQKLFAATVVMSCKAAGIDVSPETDVGRGEIDFKFSFGWATRNHVELKMAGSSTFGQNLDNQLPTYLAAESVDHGWFVIIQTHANHLKKSFVDRVNKRVQEVNRKRNITMVPIFVDATKKLTASSVGS